MNKKKLETMKYCRDEFNKLIKDPILSLGVQVGLPNQSDPLHWRISMTGPQDTPYAGGMFTLTAEFPEGYPEAKPEVRFTNKMYHLNVSPSSGHICINVLNDWVANRKKGIKPGMVTVLSSIFALFYEQNPDSPYSSEMASEYRNKRSEFDRKAREWTKQYAKM